MLAISILLLAQTPAGQQSFEQLSQAADQARQAGRTEEAIQLLRQALALHPQWKEGLWYLGALYYGHNHFSACRDTLQQLVKLEPAGSAGWSMLGLCDYEAGQYDAALEHLRQGQRSPQGTTAEIDNVAKYHLALLLTRGGDFESALGLYYALAKSGAAANRDLLQAAGTAALRRPYLPEQVPAAERDMIYRAGKAFWDVTSGNAAAGKTEFAALARDYPAAPNVHYLYGSYLLTIDPDRGLEEMQRELTISPGHIGALVTLAVEYLRRGDTAHALPWANQAVRQQPGSFAAHTVLGRILLETHELAKGVQELEKAEKLSPESLQPRIALAAAYAKLGRAKDAARERQEFLRLKALNLPGTQ